MELSRCHASYQEFKQVLDEEMNRVAEGFVRIGYLLSFAADTNIINEGGYDNVNDFAKAEYNIDATQVSRFVNIYKRFGVPGEPRLQDQYSNHGVAKLGIMLTLPDFLNEKITSGYTKSEINAIKHEYEAEQKVTPVEMEIEKEEMKGSVQYALPKGLKQVVYQFIHDEPETYVRAYSCIKLDDLKEILAPMGENTYIVRIKGLGSLSLFLRAGSDISVISLRDGSEENYDWQQLFDVFQEYFGTGTDAKDSWSNVFQEPYPEKTKPELTETHETPVKSDKNNVQQSKPKKKSRVKVVEPKPKHEPESEPAPKEDEPVKEPEEQIPGQDSILSHPEYLPEDMKEKEVLTGEVEVVTADASQIRADVITVGETANTDNDNVQQAHEGMKVEHFAPVQESSEEMIKTCKRELEQMTNDLGDHFDNEEWDKMSAVATNIVWKIKTLKKLEGLN